MAANDGVHGGTASDGTYGGSDSVRGGTVSDDLSGGQASDDLSSAVAGNDVTGGAAFLPEGWRTVLAGEVAKPYFAELTAFLVQERKAHEIYPPRGQVFTALELTPYHAVRAVCLGQDPYHGHGQAHGLAFSVQPGTLPPPSLVNMYKELHTDLACPISASGSLVPWATQGLLLLNSVLTVRASEAGSHARHGWEQFTDAVIAALNAREQPMVFILWGAYAKKKAAHIDPARHTIITSAHPSPLSAHNGFFGSRPFSKTNAALEGYGMPAIDWCLP